MTPFERVPGDDRRAAGRRVGWLRLVVVESPGARGTEVEVVCSWRRVGAS